MVLAQRLRRVANLALARQEHQHVPRSLGGQFVDGLQQRLFAAAILLVFILTL